MGSDQLTGVLNQNLCCILNQRLHGHLGEWSLLLKKNFSKHRIHKTARAVEIVACPLSWSRSSSSRTRGIEKFIEWRPSRRSLFGCCRDSNGGRAVKISRMRRRNCNRLLCCRRENCESGHLRRSEQNINDTPLKERILFCRREASVRVVQGIVTSLWDLHDCIHSEFLLEMFD